MRINESESGQALVLTAICMSVLIGLLGLAVDTGLLYRARQNVQIAADAAATAAALDYLYNQSVSSAQAAGQSAAAANGMTNGSGGITVAVNLPPGSGPDQTAGYAEAIVKAPNSTSFMAIFGLRTVTVGARAGAGAPSSGGTCGWANKVKLKGAYTVNSPNCGWYIASTASDAISVTGNGGSFTASYLDVAATSIPQHETSPTPVTEDTGPRTNPWGNLNGPSTSTGCSITSALTSVTTSNEGTVSGSAGNPVVCFTNAVTLGSGVSLPGTSSGVVYVFENGVTIGSGSTVTLGSGSYNPGTGTFSSTSGAVMDLAGGTLNQASNSDLSIYSPTSGSYDGVAILQPSSNTADLKVQFGSNNETLDGYVYAPGATVSLQDNGGGVTATGFVAGTLSLNSSTITIPSYDKANLPTTLNRKITLVE